MLGFDESISQGRVTKSGQFLGAIDKFARLNFMTENLNAANTKYLIAKDIFGDVENEKLLRMV